MCQKEKVESNIWFGLEACVVNEMYAMHMWAPPLAIAPSIKITSVDFTPYLNMLRAARALNTCRAKARTWCLFARNSPNRMSIVDNCGQTPANICS
jgi:hypothetical protein